MDITDKAINWKKEAKEVTQAIYEPKHAVARVADFLNMNVTGVWRLIWAGKLKCYRFSSRTLVGQKHLKEFLDKSERGGSN